MPRSMAALFVRLDARFGPVLKAEDKDVVTS